MPTSQKLLRFNQEISINDKGKHVRDGLSAALRTENNLWVACDERSTLERLTLQEDGSFGQHKTFRLADFIDLPESEEIDIEGLGLDENRYLWMVGSHSLARKKPRKEDSPEKQIKRLAKLKHDAKRYLLVRIPLVPNEKTGDFELCRSCTHPRFPGQTITAARLISSGKAIGNELTDFLGEDEHFRPFMKIPGKDNGFDIEGLAVEKGRIFLGIRGPVLRGWAAVLELEVQDTEPGYFKLKPDARNRPFKKHFLHLEGMGIRDLRIQNEDLLILAGPSMDLDGTIAVYRWHRGAHQPDQAIVHRKELHRLFDVPHGSGPTTGQDKAEGMALYDKDHVLIVFDTPTEARKPDEESILADLFRLP